MKEWGEDSAFVVVDNGSGVSRNRVKKQYGLCREPPELMELKKEAVFWPQGFYLQY